MQPRTEDQILSRSPITTKLGDKEYSIPLLAVMAQREWRKKLFAELAPILAALDPLVTGPSVLAGLTASLTEFPEKLVDLVFAYREYGYAFEVLRKEGVEDHDLFSKFIELRAKGLPEAPDWPRNEILAGATEEQIILAFDHVKALAFPFTPQLAEMRILLKTVGSQRLANSTN